jgi:hypothetical protein
VQSTSATSDFVVCVLNGTFLTPHLAPLQQASAVLSIGSLLASGVPSATGQLTLQISVLTEYAQAQGAAVQGQLVVTIGT